MSLFNQSGAPELDASEIRRPLTQIQKERMLAILLRNKTAFTRALEVLKPERFSTAERIYSMVWAVAIEHWETHRALPNGADMVTECRSRLELSPGTLTPQEVIDLKAFLKLCYSADRKTLEPQVGLNYLKRYLDEQLIDDTRSQLSGVQPRDTFKFLNTVAARAATFSTLTDPGISEPFSDDWDTSGRVYTPLGIGPIDHFIGGYAPDECYIILGPVGSCKTLTGIQISTKIAEINRLDWAARDRKGSLGLSYLFYYEGGEDEIRQRAIVSQAQIHKDVVAMGNLRQNLRKPGEPRREYELELFASQIRHGTQPLSEFERFTAAKQALNVNWRTIAMKPTPAVPGRGGGSYREILQMIEDDLARLRAGGAEVHCAGVVVDYLGIMIERHIQHNQLDRDSNYRPLLVRSPLFFKNEVAERFHCPTFLMHQLNAKGNSVSPTVLPKLTDSEGSNMLVENADFGIVIGKPQDDYMCLMGCGKARHVRRKPEIIFQIHGDLGYIAMPAQAQVVDQASRKMVSVEESHTIARPKKGANRGAFAKQQSSVYDDEYA